LFVSRSGGLPGINRLGPPPLLHPILRKQPLTTAKPFENPLDLQDRFNVTVKDSDDGFEVIPSVNSYVLRSIVNKYGIVQIDETIYQYDGEIAAKVPATKVIDFTDLFSHPDAKLETYVGGNVDETELKRNLEGLCNINYANHGLNEL
jgi:hypothetical protein